MQQKQEASSLQALIADGFLNGICPAFVVDEQSKRLVFVNEQIRDALGDLTGKTCHEAFWGRTDPCSFCPESQCDGKRYGWECFDDGRGRAYKVHNLWREHEGRSYRLVTSTDASDIVDLSRSVVDYLWLTQQLSQLQVRIMDDQNKTLEQILLFLRGQFAARAVAAEQETEEGVERLLCDKRGVRRLSDGAAMPGGGLEETLQVLDGRCRLMLFAPERRSEWRESREIVLNIARLYLENDLLRRRIEWENTHDKATRLFNRAAFRQHTHTLSRSASELAVLFLDIDNLKYINDTYGHNMGDRLIQKAAGVLTGVSGEQVRAYRMGGDEFVLACTFGAEEAQRMLADIDVRLRESNERIPMPQISISSGWAHATAPFDVEELLRKADERMYENKRKKKKDAGTPKGGHQSA